MIKEYCRPLREYNEKGIRYVEVKLPEIVICLKEGVYRPKLDSFLIAKTLLEMSLKGKKVLDVCTGCGIHALIAAKKDASQVVAIDIDETSVECARYNAFLNNVEIDVRAGDLFGPLREEEKFNLIVSNPPSTPTPPEQTLKNEGYGGRTVTSRGPDGRRFLNPLIIQVPKHLNKNGYFLMLHANFCNIEKTMEMLKEQGLKVELEIYEYPLGKTSGKLVGYFLNYLPENCHPFKKGGEWCQRIGVFKARKIQ